LSLEVERINRFINLGIKSSFMGRIKTKLVKRTAIKLFDIYKDKFKPDFEENKKVVQEVAEFHSKKLRNVVTGYITKLVKQNRE